MQAKHLLDHRVQILGAALLHLLDAPILHVRVAGKLEHRPGHRGSGGLVPRRHQRHELVAQLLIRQPLGILGGGPHQQRQQVATLGQCRIAAGRVDLLTQEIVDGRQVVDLATPRPEPVQRRDAQPDHHHGAGVDGAAHDRPDPVEPLRIGHPEHHAQDDLERQLVEQQVSAHPARAWPAVELLHRHLLDQTAVAGDLAPPECRRQQPPGPRVLVAVLQQQ